MFFYLLLFWRYFVHAPLWRGGSGTLYIDLKGEPIKYRQDKELSSLRAGINRINSI